MSRESGLTALAGSFSIRALEATPQHIPPRPKGVSPPARLNGCLGHPADPAHVGRLGPIHAFSDLKNTVHAVLHVVYVCDKYHLPELRRYPIQRLNAPPSAVLIVILRGRSM